MVHFILHFFDTGGLDFLKSFAGEGAKKLASYNNNNNNKKHEKYYFRDAFFRMEFYF